jgi:phosphate transport system substrate-binding protein
MKKYLIGVTALFLLSLPALAGTIRITGSDSMADLNNKLGKAFTAANPQTKIVVTAVDTTAGIATLIAGNSEIAAAARPVKPAEIAKLPNLTKVIVAKDGVAVYVHTSNRVRALTLQQIGDLLAGSITNWKVVGGADAPVHVIGREKGAASQNLLSDVVLKGRPIAMSKETKTVAENLDAVSQDPAAIGFGGAVHPDGVKALGIILSDSPMPVRPDPETVNRGVYPLTRILYYYMNGTTSPEMQSFLDFVRSEKGQQIVVSSGLFRAY